ncbi:MAG: NADPH-dependent FMN reductase [Roseinatronobacter sp.]
MSKTLNLVGLCGSLRAGSYNRLLLREGARLFGPSNFVEGNLRLPLLDEDQATPDFPPDVALLKDQVANADAVLIATPEYNKAPPGVLKNALDWLSLRGAPLVDKPVAIVSAAGGRAGGERSQYMLRWMLVPFRARVLPAPEVLVAVPKGEFGSDGRLTSDRYIRTLEELMQALRATALTRP